MEADVTERLGAGPHERTPERLGQRNGHRPRLFDSRAGALELAIPKLRTGSYFPDWLLEPRRRAERAPGRGHPGGVRQGRQHHSLALKSDRTGQ